MTLDELLSRPTISLKEAAEVLSVSVATVYRMRERGEIPVLQVGERRHVVLVQQFLPMLGLKPGVNEEGPAEAGPSSTSRSSSSLPSLAKGERSEQPDFN